MSVQFRIEANVTDELRIMCFNADTGEDVEIARSTSEDDILVERAAHMLVCDECQAYGCHVQSVWDISEEFTVDMGSANAREMFAILSIDPGEDEMVGMIDAEQFQGAVLIALAEDRIDSALASVDMTAPGRASWIECGRHAGWATDRLHALHALAAEAVRLGRPVVWS
jgi:hypothetical protein